MEKQVKHRILVTGGAGYVGSRLVPRLLESGHQITVLDLYLYGEAPLAAVRGNSRLKEVKGDLRDPAAVQSAVAGCDTVIHLACISNDPSFELDPGLGKSINRDCFPGLVRAALKAGVKRFIYASSSSVYGVKETPNVREESVCEPLTDYSRFKLDCERILMEEAGTSGMTCAIVRPATVCGYAPRQRLDLTVNILTIHALVNRRIRIFGGKQLRPNLHIDDMVRAYECFLDAPAEAVHGVPYNVGYQNRSVEDIGLIVRQTLGDEAIELKYEPTDDIRSYHINSDRVRDRLGFVPRHTIEDAVQGIAEAYRVGLLKEPMTNPLYYNIKRMQEVKLK